MTNSSPEAELGRPLSSADPPKAAPEAARAEADLLAAPEVDAWWGSYSGWTMVPSWAACVLLTGLIVWGGWALVPRGFVQGTILGLAGALWLAQGLRWGYRVFGYNYRLTTRRLYRDRGFLYTGFAVLDLASVAGVVVNRTWFDRLVGVGQLCVRPEDNAKEPLVLEGVRRPLEVAQKVRASVQAARAAAGERA
jgi:hypothetical protein